MRRKVTNRTVVLHHVTHANNHFSIQTAGIFGGLSRSVFAVKTSRIDWCVEHVCRRHGWQPSDCIVVSFTVRRRALRRVWRGVWRTSDDVSPAAIKSIAHYIPGIEDGSNDR